MREHIESLFFKITVSFLPTLGVRICWKKSRCTTTVYLSRAVSRQANNNNNGSEPLQFDAVVR
jgi:hypothetical protein